MYICKFGSYIKVAWEESYISYWIRTDLSSLNSVPNDKIVDWSKLKALLKVGVLLSCV